jgi:branched-chain amino acid transport system permease protein
VTVYSERGGGPSPGNSDAKGRAASLLASRPDIGLALLTALAALPLAAWASGDPFVLVIATRIMVFAIAALSLDLILGYGGMVSFGHAAFVGLGAYTVGILASHGVTDFLAQAASAMLVCALFALVTGAVSLRTKGVYFIMITLAFGQMAFFFMVSFSAYGGDDGLTLNARSTLFGTGALENDVVFYYVVLAVLLAFFLFARALIGARFGRVLRGLRDNAERMRAIGFSPFPYQLVAYCIAGVMAGMSGALLANQAEFVSPAFMTWQRSGELIMMVVLGGMGTLSGAILGAAAFLLLEDVLSSFSEHWRFALGFLLIVMVLFTRGGIVGYLRRVSARAERVRDG